MQEIKTYTLIRYRENDDDWKADIHRGSTLDIVEFNDENQLIDYWAACQAEDDLEMNNLSRPEYTLLLDGKTASWKDTDEWDKEEKFRYSIADKVTALATNITQETQRKEKERKAAAQKADEEKWRENMEQLKALRIQEAKELLRENGITQI